MELRNAEKQIDELIASYRDIQRSQAYTAAVIVAAAANGGYPTCPCLDQKNRVLFSSFMTTVQGTETTMTTRSESMEGVVLTAAREIGIERTADKADNVTNSVSSSGDDKKEYIVILNLNSILPSWEELLQTSIDRMSVNGDLTDSEESHRVCVDAASDGNQDRDDTNDKDPVNATDIDKNDNIMNHGESSSILPPIPLYLTAQELLDRIQHMVRQMQALLPLAEKCRQRINRKDPVTQQPRYGEKTVRRVVYLWNKLDALQWVMKDVVMVCADEDEDGGSRGEMDQDRNVRVASDADANDDANCEMTEMQNEEMSLISLEALLEKQVRHEKAYWEEQRQREETHQSQEKEIQEKREKELEFERQQQQLQEELRLKREKEELAAKAERARMKRLKDEELAKRQEQERERDYLASIPRGVEGVKLMLERLRRSCEGKKKELDVALDALHTLFSQIASRPEEVQFRRVRRDHPKFMEDIGRHDGGTEVLIAAGFVFAQVDGVDCLFTKEPDLEHDMDGWSEWFDVIKGAISAIEDEMIKG